MDKWEYIKITSNYSNRYEDKLLELLDINGKTNLQEITFEEAKEFCEKLNKNKNKWAILYGSLFCFVKDVN